MLYERNTVDVQWITHHKAYFLLNFMNLYMVEPKIKLNKKSLYFVVKLGINVLHTHIFWNRLFF